MVDIVNFLKVSLQLLNLREKIGRKGWFILGWLKVTQRLCLSIQKWNLIWCPEVIILTFNGKVVLILRLDFALMAIFAFCWNKEKDDEKRS